LSHIAHIPKTAHRLLFSLRVFLLLALLLQAILPVQVVQAASYDITAAFADFGPVTGAANLFTFRGQAAIENSYLELTENFTGTAGSAWLKNKVRLHNEGSFSAYFVLQIHDLGGAVGGEGLTFVIQPDSNQALGSTGGLGYEGIPNSFAVEIDPKQNTEVGDAVDGHVGVNTGGNMQSIAAENLKVYLPGPDWHVWVEYDGPAGVLSVRANTTSERPASPQISLTDFSLGDYLKDAQSAPASEVYVGFTASTGDVDYANHTIKRFFFHHDFLTGGIDPANHSYTTLVPGITLQPAAASVMQSGAVSINAALTDGSGSPLPNELVTFSTTGCALSRLEHATDATGAASTMLETRLQNGTFCPPGTYTVRAETVGGATAQASIQVTEAVPTAPTAIPSPAQLADGVVGASYRHTFTSDGYPAPAFAITGGALPPGLALSPAGEITGAPSAASAAGAPFSFEVTASNSAGSVTRAFTLAVRKANPLSVEITNAAALGLTSTRIGQTFPVQVKVTGIAGVTPAGAVTVTDGTGSPAGQCTTQPLVSGEGECALTSLVVGPIQVRATYSGDANYEAGPPVTCTHVMEKAIPLVTMEPGGSTVYGHPAPITVEVSAAGVPLTPTGLVELRQGATLLQTVGLVDGSASFITGQAWEPGSVALTAHYLGDAVFDVAASSETAHTITQAVTETTITLSDSIPAYGAPVTLTARVAALGDSTAVPTGTITFLIEDVSGTRAPAGPPQPVDSAGQASAPLPGGTLPGFYWFYADYTPDRSDRFGASRSDPVQMDVGRVAPVIAVSAHPAAPTTEQPALYTVTVSGQPGLPIPTGTIVFESGSTRSDAVSLIDGSASYTFTLLAGAREVTATYSGDTTYSPRVEILPVTIERGAVDLTLVSIDADPATPGSQTTAVVGQPVTITASVAAVAPATATPGGTITLTDSSGSACTIDLDAGETSCLLAAAAPIAAGANDLTLTYSGDPRYHGRTEIVAGGGPVIEPAMPAVWFESASPASPAVGEPVSIRVRVAAQAPGVVTNAGGRLTVSEIAHPENSCVTTLTDGAGACELVFLAAGSTQLVLAYEGESRLTSAPPLLVTGPTVAAGNTTVTLSAGTSSAVYGQPITLTAQAAAAIYGAGTPAGGAMLFFAGDVQVGSATAGADGRASFAYAPLATGSGEFTARYSGDASFNASTPSNAVTVTVAQALTSTTVTSAQNPSVYGTPVTYTARVAPIAPSTRFTPTGAVQFYVDGSPAGSPQALDDQGDARLAIGYEHLTGAEHTIHAEYLGTPGFNRSGGAGGGGEGSLTQRVTPSSGAALTFTTQPQNPTYGEDVTLMATLAGIGETPGGTVTFLVDDQAIGGPVPLAGGSAASARVNDYSPGLHELTVIYSGDARYSARTFDIPNAFAISRANGELLVTDTLPAAVVVGAPFTIAIQGNPTYAHIAAPTGQVTVRAGSDACTASLQANATGSAGSCTFTFTQIPPAGSGYTLEYAGDEHYTALSPAPAGVDAPTVHPAGVTVTITGAAPAEAVVGQPVVVSFTASVDSPSLAALSGVVTVSLDGRDTCSADLHSSSSGSCVLSPTGVTGSTSAITAGFSGENFTGHLAAPYRGLVIHPAQTQVELSLITSSPVLAGEAIRVQARVRAAAPGSGTPSGSVQFRVNGKNAGAPVALMNGAAASQPIMTANAGLVKISAVYLPGSGYAGSTSADTPVWVIGDEERIEIDPSKEARISFTGGQPEQPVTITALIPAGAVGARTTIVVETEKPQPGAPPAGLQFFGQFALRAYQNGQPAENFTFDKAITLSLAYPDGSLAEDSLEVLAWDGKGWGKTGILTSAQDTAANRFTITIKALRPLALAGRAMMTYYLPITIRR
jgi:hypothetical protein